MTIKKLIEKNNLFLRTQEEIAAKFDILQKSDNLFNFGPEVLLPYLTFENAKSYLKEEYVKKVESGEEKWEVPGFSIEKVAKDFLEYMEFAWGKAEDERGISASRSIQKLSVWLWLMNQDDLKRLIEDDELYNPYGAPALIAVCDKMGIKVPESLREFAKHKC